MSVALMTKTTGPLPTIEPEQYTILIVDGTPTSADNIRAYLAATGYQVEVTHFGSEAWDLIQQHQPDLIVLDMHLPDADGLNICKRIKREEALGFLPVIMTTSDTEADLRLAGMLSGADEYLLKPVDGAALLARVRALLSAKKRFDMLVATNRALADDLARQNQQLEEALRVARDLDVLKSAIVRNVGHELRTPLLQVKSAVALLAEQIHASDPEGVDRLLDMAQQATTRLEETIGNITQLGEISNVKREPVVLDESVELALRNLRRRWSSREETERVKKHYSANLPLVMGDRRGIAQVLQLLLDNALKFSPNGGPVEVLIKTHKDEQVWIGVRDYGIGIAEDQLERIFESFYQVDSSPTRSFGGAGVGLFLARLLLDKMGSRIDVKSELGKGSTFSFTLPQAHL